MQVSRPRRSPFPRIDRRLKHGVCPKCKGNLYFEADITESLLLRKCLQCGLIESYFWYERGSDTMVYLPPDLEEPEADSA